MTMRVLLPRALALRLSEQLSMFAKRPAPAVRSGGQTLLFGQTRGTPPPRQKVTKVVRVKPHRRKDGRPVKGHARVVEVNADDGGLFAWKRPLTDDERVPLEELITAKDRKLAAELFEGGLEALMRGGGHLEWNRHGAGPVYHRGWMAKRLREWLRTGKVDAGLADYLGRVADALEEQDRQGAEMSRLAGAVLDADARVVEAFEYGGAVTWKADATDEGLLAAREARMAAIAHANETGMGTSTGRAEVITAIDAELERRGFPVDTLEAPHIEPYIREPMLRIEGESDDPAMSASAEEQITAVLETGGAFKLPKVADPMALLPPKQAQKLLEQCRDRGAAYLKAGTEGMEADRRQNTYRQQRQSAASFAAAHAQATFGQTMANMAAAIEGGYRPTRFDRYMLQEPYRSLAKSAARAVDPERWGEKYPQHCGKLPYIDLGKGWDREYLAQAARIADELEGLIAKVETLDGDEAAQKALVAHADIDRFSIPTMLWPDRWKREARGWVERLRENVGRGQEMRATDPNRELKNVLAEQYHGPRSDGSLYEVPATPEVYAAMKRIVDSGDRGVRAWTGKATTTIQRYMNLGWHQHEDRQRVAGMFADWHTRFATGAAPKVDLGGPPDRSGARDALEQRLERAERAERKRFIPYDLQRIPGFFETPPPVVERMIDMADIRPGMTVLEPSAGRGGIADRLPGDVDITVAEKDARLRKELTDKGYTPHLEQAAVRGQFDRIVMNPPFEAGQDMRQVRDAFERSLKPGGTMVAITSPGWQWKDDKASTAFREFVEEHSDSIETLEGGTFKRSRTGVASVMFRLHKPG